MTDLLRQMIAIPSLSGDEKAVADFLQARLAAEGFTRTAVATTSGAVMVKGRSSSWMRTSTR